MKFHSSVAVVGFVLGLAVSPASAQDILGPWTGFYIGGHVGGAFDPNHLSFTDQSAAQDLAFGSKTGSQFLGGVHGGYDWGAGNLLIGVEGDVSFAKDINYLSTIRGRVGFPVGPFLLYGTGGAAFEGAHERFTVFQGNFPGIFNFSRNVNNTGWTAGAGVDYMIAPALSLGVEGLYYGLGSDTSGLLTPAGNSAEPFTVKDDRNFAVVRARITYHFGIW